MTFVLILKERQHRKGRVKCRLGEWHMLANQVYCYQPLSYWNVPSLLLRFVWLIFHNKPKWITYSTEVKLPCSNSSTEFCQPFTDEVCWGICSHCWVVTTRKSRFVELYAQLSVHTVVDVSFAGWCNCYLSQSFTVKPFKQTNLHRALLVPQHLIITVISWSLTR